MRSLIQVITTELEGIRFVALNYYDERGQHADQIIKPIEHELTVIDAIFGTMIQHGNRTVDVETDDEDIFKTYISIAGVNVRLLLPNELSEVYRLLSPESIEFPMIQELYLTQPSEQVAPEVNRMLSLWRRFINFLNKYINGGMSVD